MWAVNEQLWADADLRVPDDQLWAVLRATYNDMHAVRAPRNVWHAALVSFKRPSQPYLTCVLQHTGTQVTQ